MNPAVLGVAIREYYTGRRNIHRIAAFIYSDAFASDKYDIPLHIGVVRNMGTCFAFAMAPTPSIPLNAYGVETLFVVASIPYLEGECPIFSFIFKRLELRSKFCFKFRSCHFFLSPPSAIWIYRRPSPA